MRMRHRKAADRIGRVVDLGPARLEEFEPRRRRVEKIADLDPRTAVQRSGTHRLLSPTVDRDRKRVRRALGPAGNRETRDRADRRQRLAAEPEGPDVDEIVVGQLRGRMPLDRELELAGRHAPTVVGNRDQHAPGVFKRHVVMAGAGIDRVLDVFLHGGRRPLDHLARRDAVDQRFGK